MKIIRITTGLIFSVTAMFLFVACDQMTSPKKDVKLENDLDSVSYAIGIDVATNVKKSGFEEINADAIAKGFEDIFSETEPLIEPSVANNYVRDYFNKVRKMKAEKNLKEAEEFLAENGKKEGIITTESGLQYKIVTEGNGPKPEPTDMVKVNYKGTLIDGEEFDSTSEGNPAQFRVNGVISGWTEALQLMPVGSKWILYIHPDIAYGENPRPGGIIEANDLLIFEIELVEIVDNK